MAIIYPWTMPPIYRYPWDLKVATMTSLRKANLPTPKKEIEDKKLLKQVNKTVVSIYKIRKEKPFIILVDTDDKFLQSLAALVTSVYCLTIPCSGYRTNLDSISDLIRRWRPTDHFEDQQQETMDCIEHRHFLLFENADSGSHLNAQYQATFARIFRNRLHKITLFPISETKSLEDHLCASLGKLVGSMIIRNSEVIQRKD